ncbi:MAG: efflux RND transporter periplasmic adaptor subunit [Candidatus Eisenbacteria bacterium]|nr:efflux RND transporter periplasmic adaptor subunit [Candidatus Eisenbacteria bacterium]
MKMMTRSAKTRNLRLAAVFVGLLLAVLPALLGGCDKGGAPQEEVPIIPVEILEVQPDTLEDATSLTGILEAYRAVDIVSEVSGELKRLRADVGDVVEAGDVLATLEKDVLRETLNQARAALLAAEAQYELAREDFRRDSTLMAQGDIARAAYDASLMAYRAARAELQGAGAQQKLAARNLREADIRAPFGGVVSRRYAELGMYATPGIPLFRVVDIDSLRLVLGVAQRNVTRLKIGGTVRVTAGALKDRVFTGQIRSIAPEADERTRTFPVEVILVNPPGQPLRDGLVVRARLIFGALPRTIAVPREAVLSRSGDRCVFVVEDSLARRRTVELGSLIGSRYIVRSGLQTGERVVVVGMQNLKDGSPVLVEQAYSEWTPTAAGGPADQGTEEW